MFSDDSFDFCDAFKEVLVAKDKIMDALEFAHAFEAANEKSPKDIRSECIVWLQRLANDASKCKCDFCIRQCRRIRLTERYIREEGERRKLANE